MGRRLDRGMLVLLPPVLAYMASGAPRVDAPVGLIGLLFVPWIERRIAPALVPSRGWLQTATSCGCNSLDVCALFAQLDPLPPDGLHLVTVKPTPSV